MSLKHGLLGLLNYGSMTGYELDKAFKASLSFFWQAKTSQIYRELDSMERSGWLTSERIMQTEKPNKRVYTITDSGKEELENWLLLPESDTADAMRVKSAFLMRVFFAGETSIEQSIDMIRKYRDKCIESRNSLSAAHIATTEYRAMIEDEKKTKFWELSILYGELYYDASLDWANKAIAILEGEK
ncbi:PadR family transcriptional regulator [Kineothrix sp. MB12-C1]|uniref:PadR family transcriptional regulator n=1 Tax=Kineothrix sp. MB12-C1 TaxID=3070215 RepID=UPI0027D25BB5|nr:PadR family transcriptional regulator [Kineothrix sp. MB12-C1]WMC92490.1 PadR family transcriptional regulator [Kineothrix sp. MB12-C1]